MKQHINQEDLNQLNQKGKDRLREWWEPKKEVGNIFVDKVWNKPYLEKESKVECDQWHCSYCEGDSGESTKYALPLLSIGQMIEFLDEKKGYIQGSRHLVIPTIASDEIDPNTFCDFLWEEIKEVLEK